MGAIKILDPHDLLWSGTGGRLQMPHLAIASERAEHGASHPDPNHHNSGHTRSAPAWDPEDMLLVPALASCVNNAAVAGRPERLITHRAMVAATLPCGKYKIRALSRIWPQVNAYRKETRLSNSCAACHIASRFWGGTPGWMLCTWAKTKPSGPRSPMRRLPLAAPAAVPCRPPRSADR